MESYLDSPSKDNVAFVQDDSYKRERLDHSPNLSIVKIDGYWQLQKYLIICAKISIFYQTSIVTK